MVKLSQQLQQQRPTRTQRVEEKQKIERERQDFNLLKKKAEEKQKEFGTLKNIDEYEKKYKALDPEIQQFFSRPETLRNEKTQNIETTKQKIQEKIDYANDQKEKAKIKYEEKIASNRAWYDRKGENKKQYRDRFEKNKNSLEDEYEEKVAYWNGYKKGLSKATQELNMNKDLSFSNIEEYAYDVANFEEAKKQARNEDIAFKRKQENEVRKLEERGFKPQVIEESFKGQPKSVTLTFYNPKTKQWRSVEKYDIKSDIDVTGLKRLGYSSPKERILTFAGKDYKFTSRIGVYKTPKGEIVTPYEKTGITEQQLIKQQQDITYKEFKEQQKPSITFKALPSKDLPFGYGGQQTISTDPRISIISEKVYYDQKERKNYDFGISKVLGLGMKTLNFVDESVHFKLGAVPIKFGKTKDPTDYEKASIELESGLQISKENLRKWAIDKKKVDDVSKELEGKYTNQYQTAFENKYMKSLIYGDTTFEKASSEFKESTEAKIIQKKYSEEYTQKYKEIDKSTSLSKKLVAGSGITFLGGGQLLFKASRTPTRIIGTTAGVYGGVKVLNLIPPVASYGLSGGLFAYGTYKAFSPTSTITEAGGGLITAIISGATLGYGAYRYLRTPVIKTKKIPSPRMTLKSSETIGRDIKIIKNKVTANRVIYENQKLSQIGIEGRRTIVTTKGKLISKSFFEKISGRKLALDDFAVYKGVPTTADGRVGYTKALKLLKSYGWTGAEAKATLRYYSPKITEQYLSKGFLKINGRKATGEFTFLTKKTTITVDKDLGIKTRGGRTIRDVIDVEREIVKTQGKTFIIEDNTRVSSFLKDGRLIRFKDFATTKGFSISKVSKTLKGYDIIGKSDYGTILSEAKYKDILSISATRDIFPSSKTINLGFQKTRLYNQIIDISDKNIFKSTKVFKRTPIIKATPDKNIEKAIFDITGKTAKSNEANKVINKLDNIKSQPPLSTGQYERTGLQTQLKTAISPPPIKTTEVKNLIKSKQLSNFIGLQGGQLTSMTALGLKSNVKLKTSLKVNNALDNLLIKETLVKPKTLPALKSSPLLKSQLKNILDLDVPPIITPIQRIYTPPTYPKIKPPTNIPFAILFPTAKSTRSSIKKKKGFNEFAYFPDFTSRSLGLKEEVLTSKQAQERIKKTLTGLEIRRSVRVMG